MKGNVFKESSPLQKYLLLLVGSQLRRNLATSVLANGLSVVVAMASYPVFLAHLSLQEYGVWLALSAILSLVQLGGLGIAPAVTKYVADALSQGDRDAAGGYVATARCILLGVAVLAVCGVCGGRTQLVGALALPSGYQELAGRLIVPVGALSAYALLTQVPLGALSGVGRTDQLSAVQLLGRVAALGTTWMMLACGGGVWSLLWGNLAAQALIHVSCEAFIWRAARIGPFSLTGVSWIRIRRMLRFGLGMFGSSVVQMAGHPLNRVLLSRFGGVGVLPHFEIAFSGSLQVRSLPATALQALLPEFSQASAVKHSQRIVALYRRAWAVIGFGGAPLFSILFVVAPEALRLWLGARFAPEQVPCFRVMLVGAFVSLLGVPAYYYLLGIADVRSVFVSQVIQVVGTLIMVAAVLAMHARLSPLTMSVSLSVGIFTGTLWLCAVARRSIRKAAAGGVVSEGFSIPGARSRVELH